MIGNVPPDACHGLGSDLGPELKDSGWEEIWLIILVEKIEDKIQIKLKG